LLRKAGGRIAEFPHCPRCCSYALYRKNNIGVYECETCGLKGIEEHIARRLT
jgi:Zn ribbon nucleic-acid-binding protein